MKIVLANTYDRDGGAAAAVYRLHTGLKRVGADSHMAVQYKTENDPSIHAPSGKTAQLLAGVRSKLDRMPLVSYPNRTSAFWSLQWFSNDTIQRIKKLKPDIVHLNWIGRGFLPVKDIREFNCPVVWTFHDMWGFTGGCHYDQDCGRWKINCGSCPQLGSNTENDLSRKTWERKKKAWKDVRINVLTPSRWMANCVRSSSLFQEAPVKVIPYGIDVKVFRPESKEEGRRLFQVPADRSLIVFGAMNSTTDHRKGWQYLHQVLKILAGRGWGKKTVLGIFGASKPENPPDFGIETHYLGRFNDEKKLSLLYSSADVFLAPSLQDNLPNTVMESLACGTPCVAFNIGGMSDMIEHKMNGYLAQPFEAEDFVQGVEWVLENKERHELLSRNAREKVLRSFELEAIAKEHMKFYDGLLNKKLN